MGLSCGRRIRAALVAASVGGVAFLVAAPAVHAATDSTRSRAATAARRVVTRTALGSASAPVPTLRTSGAVPLPRSGPAPVPDVAGPDPDVPGAPAPLEGVPEGDAGRDGTLSESKNWSGQIDTGTTFTAVAGEWTVPAVAPSVTLELAANWIGIGGAGITQLIQTGTMSVTTGDSTTYYAWYELLPTKSIAIPETVSAGNEMLAVIKETSTDRWYIGIEDITKGWTATATFTYNAGLANSAEWISERPYDTTTQKLVTLADFGSVRFHDLRVSGADVTVSALTSTEMVNTAGQVIAYPGPVTSTTTDNFTNYYGAPGTSTPTPPKTSTPPKATTPPKTPTPPKATTPPKAVPVVSSVAPSSGPTSGGTVVTITGTDLSEGVSVHFGVTQASSLQVTSPTRITATSPPHVAGPAYVTVTIPGGTSTASAADLFKYLAPKVTALSTRDGPTGGGTVVTIIGSDFTRGARVRFGTETASRVTVVSPTRITATSPPHVAGSVHVTVTIPGGTSAASAADLFKYLP